MLPFDGDISGLYRHQVIENCSQDFLWVGALLGVSSVHYQVWVIKRRATWEGHMDWK